MPTFSSLHIAAYMQQVQVASQSSASDEVPQLRFLKRAETYTTSLRKIYVSRGNKRFIAESQIAQAREAQRASAQQGDSIPRHTDCSTELSYFLMSSRNLAFSFRQKSAEIGMQLSPNKGDSQEHQDPGGEMWKSWVVEEDSFILTIPDQISSQADLFVLIVISFCLLVFSSDRVYLSTFTREQTLNPVFV